MKSPLRKEGPLSEKEIQKVIEKYFLSLGYKVIKSKNKRFKYCDIIAEDIHGNRFYTEVKGNLPESERGDYLQVVGQIIERVTNSTDVHYIALPDKKVYRNLAKKFHTFVRKKLNIRFIFVNAIGEVRCFSAGQSIGDVGSGKLVFEQGGC